MRERIEIDADTAAGVELAVEVAAAVEERRARLAARVVGPAEEDEEGADEVASARFRLRVSIQNPKPPSKLRITSPI